MRRLYAAVFGIAALAVLLIGGVLAWTGSASGKFSAQTGKIEVELANFSNTGNKVVPSGNFINEQNGQIRNKTSANPGIAVHITGGSVSDISSNGADCNKFIANDGLGKPGVDGQVRATGTGDVSPGAVGGAWSADIRMKTGAPDDCQERTLSYTVTVNVAT